MQPVLGHVTVTRGAPVLQWAGHCIREDKDLVENLVWSNPSNLCYASPALQADAEVAAAALASPFYAEKDPQAPVSCVLRFLDHVLRAKQDVVLAALARSGYELEFACEALRADPYVVAWAGAPVGAAQCRERSKTCMRLLKSGVSVEHVEANWRALSEDEDLTKGPGNDTLSRFLAQWPRLPLGMPQHLLVVGSGGESTYKQNGCKHSVCAYLKTTLDARCPLCLRVAPPVRNVLWPTRELEWDGVF